jgi:hypothetical protein
VGISSTPLNDMLTPLLQALLELDFCFAFKFKSRKRIIGSINVGLFGEGFIPISLVDILRVLN